MFDYISKSNLSPDDIKDLFGEMGLTYNNNTPDYVNEAFESYNYIQCIKNNNCIKSNCYTKRQFGSDIFKIPYHCAEHKTTYDKRFRKVFCVKPFCQEFAVFGETDPLYCSAHKKTFQHECVVIKRCQVADCYEPAEYGMTYIPLTCAIHKHARHCVKVKNVRCFYQGCKKYPQFGTKSKYRIACGKHKQRYHMLIPKAERIIIDKPAPITKHIEDD